MIYICHYFFTGWPVELPAFQLTPSSSQVVFEGDKLPFECQASFTDKTTKMLWVREDRVLETNKSEGMYIHEQKAAGGTIIKRLVLDHLSPKHNGVWKCVVQTRQGNATKSVNIIVISDDTVYCSQKITTSNKGEYTWPKTVQGVQIDLSCQAGPASSYTGESPAQAYYRCNTQGKWVDLDESRCGYSSQFTRVLEQYAEVGLKINIYQFFLLLV